MVDPFYRSLPQKRVAAGALFLNEQRQILIVKPTYRPDWLLPGGTIELDKSPRQGCTREVAEELGLDVQLQQLLCIDYIASAEKGECLQFVFYGKILSDAEILAITLPLDELSEYHFLSLSEIDQHLSVTTAARLPFCLQALEYNTTIYLENGALPI